MSPPNSCVEPLTPRMMALGDGTFERESGLDEVMREEPHGGITVLVRRDRRACFLSLPCNIMRKWPSSDQEVSP